MKVKMLKKVLVLFLSMSMMLSLTATAQATKMTDDEHFLESDEFVIDDEDLLTDSEMEELNAEYQTKEEAIAEQAASEDKPIITPRAALPSTPGNALALSGVTPYYVGSYTLGANQAGYVKLSATGNYNLSAFTTGSTDTYIEVYSNAACTNMVTRNDDGGHGLNALTYFYITSGSTYYVKVRGYSSLTTGSYTFVLHRGRPTSRWEKNDMFSTYNSSSYRSYNNCYTYALGYYVNPRTGKKFRTNGQNPGEMSGSAISMKDLSNATTAKSKIQDAMTRDFNYFGGDYKEISATAQPRSGYFKVGLFLHPGRDYHWYRQLPNGQWGHKPGQTAARNYDNSNKIIYQPDNCNRNGSASGGANYTSFLGWYEIRTPISVSPKSASFDFAEETFYPVNENLTMEDIITLTAGTDYDEAMEVLGDAHDYIGSGIVGSVYELVDGTEVAVYYANNCIDQIRIINPDDSYDIIVE